MAHFSVRVLDHHGDPVEDIGVMIDYGFSVGTDEKRTDNDGWVEFHNRGERPGRIWVHGHDKGSQSLRDGKAYSFTV